MASSFVDETQIEATALPVQELSPKALSPNQLVWRRFLRHRAAVAGAIGMLLIFVIIIVGTILTPLDRATRPDVVNRLTAPTMPWQFANTPVKDQHIFGTDSTGRD